MQFRRWRKRIGILSENLSLASSSGKKKMVGPGHKLLHLEVFAALDTYFEALRQQLRRVSVNMLCAKYKEVSDLINVQNSVLRHHVYRWMKRSNIVHCRITHQAQKYASLCNTNARFRAICQLANTTT